MDRSQRRRSERAADRILRVGRAGPSLQDQRNRFVLSGLYVAPKGIRVSSIICVSIPSPKAREPEMSTVSWDFTLKNWSGRLDSNQRPPAPKAGALPGCATPRPEDPDYLMALTGSGDPRALTPRSTGRSTARRCGKTPMDVRQRPSNPEPATTTGRMSVSVTMAMPGLTRHVD